MTYYLTEYVNICLVDGAESLEKLAVVTGMFLIAGLIRYIFIRLVL